MDAWLVARPCEPEQPARERDTADDHRGKTPFRNRNVVVSGEFSVIGGLHEHNVQPSQQHSNNHAEKWQSANTGVHVMDLLENNGVGGKEEVEQAVNEGHVDT